MQGPVSVAWKEFWNTRSESQRRYWGRFIAASEGYSQYPYSTDPKKDLFHAVRDYNRAKLVHEEDIMMLYGFLIPVYATFVGRRIDIEK